MITKVTEGVWKIPANSNAYYIEEINTIIDTGNRINQDMFKRYLSQIIDLDKIETVIFTHLHYDHIGNFDLFSNATFYASTGAIETLQKDRHGTILNLDMENKFDIELTDISKLNLPKKYEVIYTPGHTKGCICLYDKEKQILYSGDTILNGGTGRTDLPTSDEENMQKTVIKLIPYNYKFLCAGHEY